MYVIYKSTPKSPPDGSPSKLVSSIAVSSNITVFGDGALINLSIPGSASLSNKP